MVYLTSSRPRTSVLIYASNPIPTSGITADLNSILNINCIQSTAGKCIQALSDSEWDFSGLKLVRRAEEFFWLFTRVWFVNFPEITSRCFPMVQISFDKLSKIEDHQKCWVSVWAFCHQNPYLRGISRGCLKKSMSILLISHIMLDTTSGSCHYKDSSIKGHRIKAYSLATFRGVRRKVWV